MALAFLKMYTGLSAPKLMEALNRDIHYQIFCGIRISPESQLTNYKLIDSILLELSRKLKLQEQQKLLADAWKPYMKNLDTMCTDASCYESLSHNVHKFTLDVTYVPKGVQLVTKICYYLEFSYIYKHLIINKKALCLIAEGCTHGVHTTN